MTKLITVNMPQNASEEEKHLFEPFVKYELADLKIKYLQNILVTYTGFALDETGLIKESHHDYPDQYATYLNEAMAYCKEAFDNPDCLIELNDDNVYLHIHHPWFNYWHWMTEAILRVWMVKDKLKEMILILPDYYAKVDFIMNSLAPFEFKDIFFMPHRKSILVKNVCMPQIKPIADSYHYAEINQIREVYKEYAINFKKIKIDLGGRLYISRKKAAKRRIANEQEIEDLVKKYNFKIIHNEDFNFLQQISIYSHADILVSIHGAGLTNMLFMREGAKILEFHKKKTNKNDWHSFAFWYLAEALSFKYFHQVCCPTNDDDHFFKADYIVDTRRLEENLISMIKLN